MQNNRKQYSAEDKAQIQKLHAEGKSDREIAQALGRTMHGINVYRRKMNLAGHKRNKAAARQGYENGCKKVGSFAKRRWDAAKFEAFMDGAPTNITPTEWKYLKLLREAQEPMPSKAIARAVNMGVAAAKKVLCKLVAKGYVDQIRTLPREDAQWKAIPWNPFRNVKKKQKEEPHADERQ